MRKPRRVMCKNSRLHKGLTAQCDRSHEHANCSAKDLTATQMYTQEMANIVHQCISNDARESAGRHERTKAHSAPMVHIRGVVRTACARIRWVDTDPCMHSARVLLCPSTYRGGTGWGSPLGAPPTASRLQLCCPPRAGRVCPSPASFVVVMPYPPKARSPEGRQGGT